MIARAVAALLLLAPAAPGATTPESAVESRLARRALEMKPGSLEPLGVPDVGPYKLFRYTDPTGQKHGAAVAGDEVALSDDGGSLAQLFSRTKFFDTRSAADALVLWTELAQVGEVLGEKEVAALDAEEKKAAHPPKLEKTGDGQRVTGFIREGQEIYRVQLDIGPSRADATLKPIGEVIGRDQIDEAARALNVNHDEVGRMAAAAELGGLPDRRAFDALVKGLGDDSAGVRQAIVDSLKRQGDHDPALKQPASMALRKAAIHEKDAAVKKSMTDAADELGVRKK